MGWTQSCNKEYWIIYFLKTGSFPRFFLEVLKSHTPDPVKEPIRVLSFYRAKPSGLLLFSTVLHSGRHVYGSRRWRAQLRCSSLFRVITEKLDVRANAKRMWMFLILSCMAPMICGRVCVTNAWPIKIVFSESFVRFSNHFWHLL